MKLDLEQTPSNKPVLITVLCSFLAVQGVIASFYYALLLSGSILMLVFGDGDNASRAAWALYALAGIVASAALLYACLHVPRRNMKSLNMAIVGQVVLLCGLVTGNKVLPVTGAVALLMLTRPSVRRYITDEQNSDISAPVHPAL